MGEIIKIKVSGTPKVPDAHLEDFKVLGLDPRTNNNAHADMEQLRGNTAFAEWEKKNPGKTYEDWIKLLQEPAQQAADTADKKMTEFASAEKMRATNEAARVDSEKNRASAEEARQLNEDTRVKAETARETNEDARKKEETDRIEEEKKRATAESGRVEAEGLRVQAEDKRATDTAEALQDVKTATDKLNNQTEHRDEIRTDGWWYRWDDELQDFKRFKKAESDLVLPFFNFNSDTGFLSVEMPEELSRMSFEVNNGVLSYKYE